MWVGAQRAVLQLSLRYRTDEHLWFTFFHEAAHLLLHPRKGVFLEVGGDAVDEVREVEADRWARDYLIAPSEWQAFVEQGDFSLDAIGGLAERLSIAPGLVVGRLQHEGRIGFAARNRLKRKLDPAKLAGAAG
jgi:hypothetical protein